MQEIITSVLSEIKFGNIGKKLYLGSQVGYINKKAYGQSKVTNDLVFILEGKTSQVHIVFMNDHQNYEKKTIFLTPQPTSYPLSLLISPCGSLLLLLTETSAHVVDVSKLDSILVSKQTKIVAKLLTVYDSLSGEVENSSRLMRARWHPSLKGFLLLLNEDSNVIFFRCINTTGVNLTIKEEFRVSVLQICEHSEQLTCNDEENSVYLQKSNSLKLNLSAAMGSVCRDFDIGSTLFSSGKRIQDGPLAAPVYVICENGDIIMVHASPTDPSTPLVRMVRIFPATEEYYTFDFDTVTCIRSYESNPDVLCLGSRTGHIFHGICLHIPPSVLPQLNLKTQGWNVPVLYLVDSIDLELSEFCKSNDMMEFSKLTMFVAHQFNATDYYLCVHDIGIHYVALPWMRRLKQLFDNIKWSNLSNVSLNFLRKCPCIVKHLLLTKNRCKGDAYNLSSVSSDHKRCIVGILPLSLSRLETSSPKASHIGDEANNRLLVLFASQPEIVTVFLPSTPLYNTSIVTATKSLETVSKPILNKNDIGDRYETSNNCLAEYPQTKESEFVLSCRRILAEDNARLPIISTESSDDEEFSEAEFVRFFLNATNTLRTSRLSRLSDLSASLLQFADYVEGQLAAQLEEATFLGSERDQLHSHAASLTDRHSRILERQEALNHRLSELARRIYSIERGLTDAELEMQESVQNIRDRLKSGLLGWFENIRLQYDHLTARSREAASLSSTNRHIYRHISEKQNQAIEAPLSPSQVQLLISELKEEGNDINKLVRAVERFNLLSSSSLSVLH